MLSAPGDIADAERTAWSVYAPLAITQGTLTVATIPGFRELCHMAVHQAELAARIATLGRTSAEADRLVRRWEKAVQLLGGKLKDYKLTAFGKPEPGTQKKAPAANPWATVAQK